MRRDTCGFLPSWAVWLVAVSACAGAATAPEDPSTYSNPQIESLAQALGGRRLFESRLTGGFAWARCEPPAGEAADGEDLIPSARCGQLPEPGTPERARLVDVWREIVQAGPGQEESVELLHARGVGHLLWSAEGDEGQLEQAVADLERAAELAPGGSARRAAVLNDLAAAYRVRAGTNDRVLDLVQALDAIERAKEIGEAGKEVLFNQALLLDGLALREVAGGAWDEVLTIEASVSWQRESERRSERPSRPTAWEQWASIEEELTHAALAGDQGELRSLVRQAPLLVWSFAQNIWLAAWADSWLQTHTVETEALALSRKVGEALATLGLDGSVGDAVRAIDEARGDPDRLLALAEGHSAYGSGYRIERGREEGDLCSTYRRAEDRLAAAASPFALWAGLSVVQACLENTNQPLALAKVEALLNGIQDDRYPALSGRLEWMLALGATSKGLFEAAFEHGLSAREHLSRAADPDVASVTSIVADSLRNLGRLEESWRFRLESLRGFSGFHNPAGYHNALTGAINALFLQGEHLAAGPLVEELVLSAEEEGNPTRQAYAAGLEAGFLSRVGRRDEALEALEAARSFAEGIERQDRRRQVDADLALTGAGIEIEVSPSRAGHLLDEAYRALSDVGRLARLPEVYLLQARNEAARGAIDRAEEKLRAAFRELEHRRGLSIREEHRISFFEAFQSSIDEILEFFVEHGQVAEAFLYAERSRSRALLDWVIRGVVLDSGELERVSRAFPDAGPLEEIRSSLGKEEVVLEYAVLPDKLVIWVVRNESVSMEVHSVRAEELLENVTRFRDLLESEADFEDIVSQGERLYEHLIAPVEGALSSTDRLLVVPDRFLHRVPFGALYDRGSGAFLIERFPFGVLPSSTLLTLVGENGQWPAVPARMSVLAVAPRTTRYPALKWAGEETREIAALFPRTSLLEGDAADRRTVLELLPRHEIAHFATHARYNDEVPMRSVIALSDAGLSEEQRWLTARAVYGLDLKQTRLAVLAACQTTDGYPGAGREGLAGWARALFAAGVPRVIAGLWDLGDEPSHVLIRKFYRELTSASPAAALRAAQVAMIHNERVELRSPSNWAQFQLYGPL